MAKNSDSLDVYVQLIGGGPPISLTSDPRPDVSPAWSPGRCPDRVCPAFRRREQYLLDTPLGGRERKLTDMYSIWSEGKAFDWSPDGKLLVAAGRKPHLKTRTAYF